MSYRPGASVAANAPCESVTVSTDRWVVSLTIVTVTPGMGAPVESRTIPARLPGACADAIGGNSAAARSALARTEGDMAVGQARIPPVEIRPVFAKRVVTPSNMTGDALVIFFYPLNITGGPLTSDLGPQPSLNRFQLIL